jgi:hypothetical protein
MHILFLLLVVEVELIVIASLCATSKSAIKQSSNLQYYHKIKKIINEFKLFMRYEQVFVLDLILL